MRLGEYNKDTEKDCVTRQGIEDCAEPHQDIDIEEAIAHKEYVGAGGRYHDIGLLRLSKKARISGMKNFILNKHHVFMKYKI